MLTVRPSTPEDVTYLLPNLRKEDLQEIEASGWRTAELALSDGLKDSTPCLSIVTPADEAIAMFGVVPSGQPELGYVWLLGSDEIKNHKTQFLRESRKWLDFFHQQFPVLANCVDARNTVHIAWLRWCGFSFLRRVNADGPGNLPFYEFARLNV